MPYVTPLLSVVIPTFNNQTTILRAVQSVLRQQDDRRIELVIVNDGSTDNTLSTLNNLSDNRLTIVTQNNHGAGHARNRAIEQARGHWVLCLDADDALTSGALSHILDILEQHPHTDCLLGAATTITLKSPPKNRYPGHLPTTAKARIEAYLLHKSLRVSHGCSVFLRQHLLNRPYAEHLQQSEDIPVFAYALSQNYCLTTNIILAEIYRQPGSRRTLSALPGEHAEQLCNEVFRQLPAETQHWRNDYFACRLLSQARNLDATGKYREAAALSLRALRLQPRLRWYFNALKHFSQHTIRGVLRPSPNQTNNERRRHQKGTP